MGPIGLGPKFWTCEDFYLVCSQRGKKGWKFLTAACEAQANCRRKTAFLFTYSFINKWRKCTRIASQSSKIYNNLYQHYEVFSENLLLGHPDITHMQNIKRYYIVGFGGTQHCMWAPILSVLWVFYTQTHTSSKPTQCHMTTNTNTYTVYNPLTHDTHTHPPTHIP